MSSRPRRSAATRANEVISVHAKWADTSERSERSTMSSRRSGRTSGAAAASRDAPDSPGELSVEVKTRQAPTAGSRRGNAFEGGEIVHGKRNRGAKKSYVVDSSPDDDEEEEEEEAEIEEDEDDDLDDGEEDAEGEDDMEVDAEADDVDAEGEDADGDIDMDVTPSVIRPTIKVSRQARPAQSSRAQVVADDDDDDDDELSDPGMSDVGDTTIGFGDETMADEDAEGEEIEVAGEEEDEEEDEEEEEDAEGELDSEEDGSQAGTPDVAKMTKRQRARFEDEPQEYMKLSDEVQVKKVFTAEELSMRRQEMARRRRNLSEKRNEEVKMETINKLLKKQAPKVNRKAAAAAAAADNPDDIANRANPLFIRWVSKKDGSSVSVPDGMLAGPAGEVFKAGGLSRGKMVEEVA